MNMTTRRSMLTGLAAYGLAHSPATLHAAPQSYSLDDANSEVGFIWRLGNDAIRGQMPILRAELTIDVTDVRRSSVQVDLDAANARAGFIFATQALRGPKMLDANNHPIIRFHSTSIRKSATGASIDGQITIRDVTRPIRLEARLFRPADSAPTDLGHLRINLEGTINRRAFGATGWPDMIADEVQLEIDVYINARS